ncbi:MULTISPECIES: hypothetical protein [unclassified Streptomyces]|nr:MULTISPECIES: hypothetical protein [unclassified Streptomyces]
MQTEIVVDEVQVSEVIETEAPIFELDLTEIRPTAGIKQACMP